MKNLILKGILPPVAFVVASYFLDSIIVAPIVFILYALLEKGYTQNNTRNNYALALSVAAIVFSVTRIVKGYTGTVDYSVLGIISVVLLGPISEELIFRGLCFKNSVETFGPVPASVLSSLLFAVAHDLEPLTLILSFLTGLALCFLLRTTKDLKFPIIAHILINVLLII